MSSGNPTPIVFIPRIISACLFCCLFHPFSSFPQFPCGTIISKSQTESLQRYYSEMPSLKKPAEDTFFVPVKVHIIRKSDGTGGLDTLKIQEELESVNYFYKNAKIQFELCGQMKYIDNSLYRTFNAPDEEDLLTQSTESPRVINIYFTDTVIMNGTRVCGYSFLPMGPNTIFIDNACVNNGNTLAHEIGHFFSLLHTHGKSNTVMTDELVNGSNCAIAGDYICDTPADPNLSGKVTYNTLTHKCTYTGNETDANGDYFLPMVENVMSYSKAQCTDSFTTGQFMAIRNSLFYHGRIDLICTDESDIVGESRISEVYPNPFRDYFFVYYQLSDDSRVTLTLYDLLGKQVSVLYDNIEPKGFMKLFYPWGDTFLNAGIYFLKMEVNEKKVSVQKIARMNY